MPIRPDWDIVDRVRAYTYAQSDREKTLALARELERIAAGLQHAADELRRLA